LETVRWEFKRPNQTVTLQEELKSCHSHGEISVTTVVMIGEYLSDYLIFGDNVSVRLATNLTVTRSHGFLKSIYIALCKDNQSEIGWIIYRNLDFHGENLSLVNYSGASTHSKAHVSLK